MAAVETGYPHVAEWVDGCGWIEVRNQDFQGFGGGYLDEICSPVIK